MNMLRSHTQGIGMAVLAVIAVATAGCSNTNAGVAQTLAASEVNECGAVISTPGNYGVGQSLTSTSATVDCIQIASPGVRLDFAPSISLKGPGGTNVTAAGVRILQGSNGVQLLLSGTTIEGFGVGIEVDASGVSISGTPAGATVTGNAAQGVYVNGANGVLIDMVVSQKNGAAGLELWQASGVIVQGLTTVQNNAGYGLWLHSSSGNQFFTLDAFNNKLSGIYLGELTSDQNTSNHNVFVNAGAVQNGGAGLEISLDDSYNVVTASTGQSNLGQDAVDKNPDCGTDSWTGNNFATTNVNCIH